MNYDEAMLAAEKAGTTRRNKHRPFYRRVSWGVGATFLAAALIWLPSGPLQTYQVYKNKPKQVTERATRSGERTPMDSLSAGATTLQPLPVSKGEWKHVMLLPKERKFLRIDVNTHVEIIGKGVRVLDICADKQARAPRQCPAASPAQQVSIENERDETNIILVQAFS